MDAEYWQKRWREGRIGFHGSEAQPALVRHHGTLADEKRVFVPLCGKSHDLAWLEAQGHEVVGVELSELAARAFFAEHQLETEESREAGMLRLTAGAITIYVGDFFDLTTRQLGECRAAYDRAAWMALPEAMRGRYSAKLRSLLAAPAKILLVTIDHDAPGGPPFAIKASEIEHSFSGARIQRLERTPATDLPKHVAHDASYAFEDVHSIES